VTRSAGNGRYTGRMEARVVVTIFAIRMLCVSKNTESHTNITTVNILKLNATKILRTEI